jgi:putative glutamine amidotransferase
MSTKKKIGISFSRTNFHYYWNWFTKEDLGNDMELVELSFEKNNTADIGICDGFVLTGGVDIDTSFYDGAESYDHQPDVFQVERDLFEKDIFLYAQNHKLPLLGICRGLQLVNVFQGGKLIEDINDANLLHKKDGDTDKLHTINVEPNSLLAEITGSLSSKVNSAHHQAVRPGALGENLLINAWSAEDSIIEGLEYKDKSGTAFMLCVQWHPERMSDKENNPFSIKLKKRFLAEVKKSKQV